MNKKLKAFFEILGIALITLIILMSSSFNPWIEGTFTEIQTEILEIAHSVREGFLAYVELDGHYGPVLYEFYGLGYLPTETHIVHFIMECVIVFFSVLFIFKTAKLYTSVIFAFICTFILTVFEMGALTHAGAEEMMFFIMSLTTYHVARQLKDGFFSYHTYLLAIDCGLVFFLQPGYSIFWLFLLVFFAVKFWLDKIDREDYKAFVLSAVEGIITVLVPMGLYLWYFKNAKSFWKQVVEYNFENLGSFAAGLKTVIETPWFIIAVALVIVIIIKKLKNRRIDDLCCWLSILVAAYVVIALQGDNLPTGVQLTKALYVVPFASALSIIEKLLGISVEER